MRPAVGRRFLLAILVTALVPSLPMPPAHPQQRVQEARPDGRQFRDWLAYCEPDLACVAETHHLGGRKADFHFRLTRRADEPTWNLVLATHAARPAFPYDVQATASGEAASFTGNAAIGAYGAPSDLYLLGPNAQKLLDLLGPGRELIFEFLRSSGDLHTPRFSLSGLSAALLWIDEKQGRVGSPRRAGNPPKGLTPVDNFGDRPATVPAALLEFHRTQDDCEPLENLAHNTLFTVGTLEPGRMLYLIPCAGGAYNPSFAAYRNAASGFVRTRFAGYSDEASWNVTSQLVNPEWNDQTKTLVTLDKGRGIADCGSRGEWRYRAGALRLERFFHKRECDGKSDPGDFPLIYEAKQIPPPR